MMMNGKHFSIIPFSNISGQGKRRGRGNALGGSSSFVKWVQAGLIILGACNALFSKPAKAEPSREEEKEMLKMKASQLRKQLAEIENRLAALEGGPEQKVIESGRKV